MRRFSILLILFTCVAQIDADQPAPTSDDATKKAESRADRGKALLELPVKNLITANPNAIQPLLISPSDPPGAETLPQLKYVPKARIESSTKRLVNQTANVGSAPSQEPVQTPVALPFKDPRMPPLDVGKGFIERPVEGLLLTPIVTPNGGAPIFTTSVAEVNNDVAEEPTPDSKLDRRKKVIEGPVKKVVTDVPKAEIESAIERAISEPTGDITKRKVIEFPVAEVVADESASDETPQANPVFREEVASDEKPVDENPRVEPGKVKWHASFDAAKQAAKESGKPVLLFHLMGQLDQRFT